MGRREGKIMDTVDKIKTFKITERYITEDTWIVEATSEQEARDISLGVDPIKEEITFKKYFHITKNMEGYHTC